MLQRRLVRGHSRLVRYYKTETEEKLKRKLRVINSKLKKKLTLEEYFEEEKNAEVADQLVSQIQKQRYSQNNYFSMVEDLVSQKRKNQEPEEAQNELKYKRIRNLQKSRFDNENQEKVKFTAPPQQIQEIEDTLKEADARYEENKVYLFGRNAVQGAVGSEINMREKLEESILFNEPIEALNEEGAEELKTKADSFNASVPEHMEIQRFRYKSSTAVVLGVKPYSLQHASYIHDFMKVMEPETIMVNISPDHPMFIKIDSLYRAETGKISTFGMDFQRVWRKFVSIPKINAKFYVSSTPRYLSEAMLSGQKFNNFVQDNLLSNKEYDFGPTIAYEKPRGAFSQGMLPSVTLTSLLYGFNNPDLNLKYVIGDFPILILYDYAARSHKLVHLMALYKKYAIELQNKNYQWDPMVFADDLMIRPKAKYQAEILRQACIFSDRVLVISDKTEMSSLEQEWMNLPKQHQSLTDLIMELQNVQDPSILTQERDLAVKDYIEKLVILDLLSGQFIDSNYMKYGIFPFSGYGLIDKGTKGNAPLLWRYFQTRYKEMISDQMLEQALIERMTD